MSSTIYTLGVDLDNVTAQYTEGFRHYMVGRGYSASELPNPRSYNFVEAGWPFKSVEEYLAAHMDFVSSGGFLGLKPMPGASEALHRLIREHDIQVRIITHRIFGKGSHARSTSDTVNWLDLNNIPYHDSCFVSDKSDIGSNLLVDDAPSNVEAVRNVGGQCLVFDQLYNQELGEPRAYNWEDVYRIVVSHKAVHTKVIEHIESFDLDPKFFDIRHIANQACEFDNEKKIYVMKEGWQLGGWR